MIWTLIVFILSIANVGVCLATHNWVGACGWTVASMYSGGVYWDNFISKQ